jgi:hypothetical protein
MGLFSLKAEDTIMAKATGQDVKALLLQAWKVPNEPGSVHDVKPLPEERYRLDITGWIGAARYSSH